MHDSVSGSNKCVATNGHFKVIFMRCSSRINHTCAFCLWRTDRDKPLVSRFCIAFDTSQFVVKCPTGLASVLLALVDNGTRCDGLSGVVRHLCWRPKLCSGHHSVAYWFSVSGCSHSGYLCLVVRLVYSTHRLPPMHPALHCIRHAALVILGIFGYLVCCGSDGDATYNGSHSVRLQCIK